MPSKTPYVSEKRGADLAAEVLETIEAEEAFNQRAIYGSTHHIDKRNAWTQHTWGEVHLNDLPPGTEIELITEKPRDLQYLYHELAILDSPVSCGTAMCFAGHAATLAGDRMLFGVTSEAAARLRARKGFRSNVKRFVNKFRSQGHEHRILTDAYYGLAAPVSWVLTREGKVERIEDRARELLGLSHAESDALFSGSNSLRNLSEYVARMKDGRHLTTGRKKRH